MLLFGRAQYCISTQIRYLLCDLLKDQCCLVVLKDITGVQSHKFTNSTFMIWNMNRLDITAKPYILQNFINCHWREFICKKYAISKFLFPKFNKLIKSLHQQIRSCELQLHCKHIAAPPPSKIFTRTQSFALVKRLKGGGAQQNQTYSLCRTSSIT